MSVRSLVTVSGFPETMLERLGRLRLVRHFNPRWRDRLQAWVRRLSFLPPLRLVHILQQTAEYEVWSPKPDLAGDLEGRLAAAAAGDAEAAFPLAAYHSEDARVRSTLVGLGRAVPLQKLRPVAQALGIVGGPGAVELLLSKLQDQLRDPAFRDPLADALLTAEIGTAALRLDPQALEAAAALADLVRHSPPDTRQMIARAVGPALVDQPSTLAQIHLRRAYSELAWDGDDSVFLAAAEGLMRCAARPGARGVSVGQVLHRCGVLLRALNADLRQEAVRVLRNVPPPLYGAAMDSLLRILPGLHVEEATEIATWLVPFLPSVFLERLIAEALRSPLVRTRQGAVGLLRQLPLATAQAIAGVAMKTEQDEQLREKLAAIADRGGAAGPENGQATGRA